MASEPSQSNDVRPEWRGIPIDQLSDAEVELLAPHLRHYVQCQRASGLSAYEFACREMAVSQ